MSSRPSLMAIFAHPDDESVNMGGTLARCTAEGVELSLVCATRGEWGTIGDPAVATRETLGATREAELRAACEILGIRWLRFLECADGGLNTAVWPRIAAAVATYIHERDPDVVVTFGPDGMYGHQDHTALCHIVTAAFKSVAFTNPLRRLYFVQYPRQSMIEAAAAIAAEHPSAHFWHLPPHSFGVSDSSITTVIDVSEYIGTKLRALRCHRSQLDENNAFRIVSEATARRFFGREFFHRALPPMKGGEVEATLFRVTHRQARAEA
jgi:LmbE family N-acetylglucosaminyl deacetylase